MLKKFCLVLLATIVIFTFSVSVLAAGDEDGAENSAGESAAAVIDEATEKILGDLIGDKSLESTEQFLVTITRPEGDETTFKKSYVICGTTDETDIQVILAKYDAETDTYKEFKNTDGLSRWDIGSFGLFSKEVILSEGANKLKIIVYKKSEVDSLKRGENLQVNYFTVTVLNESIKNKIINSVINITDMFTKLFEKK